MTAAYKRKGRRVRTIKVPMLNEAGRVVWRQRSTGTMDPATARKMTEMARALGPQGARAWDVLARVGEKTLSVPALYDLWGRAGRDLQRLRAMLEDVDLTPYLDAWQAGVAATVSADTARHYRVHVERLLAPGRPFYRSQFAGEAGTRAIGLVIDTLTVKSRRKLRPGETRADLEDVKPASKNTKRKAGAAFASFAGFLIRRGILDRRDDPTDLVELPAVSAFAVARHKYHLEDHELQLIADAQPEPYRTLSALMGGTGVEVSVALTLRRRDVDVAKREVFAAGGKTRETTSARTRRVRVATWAWPYVEALVAGRTPDAPLFPGVPSRYAASDAHRAAVDALVAEGRLRLPGYTMRDHRHSVTVRKLRAGVDRGAVAAELGHANDVMIGTVYGIYEPTPEEREKFERQATVAAEERRKALGEHTNG